MACWDTITCDFYIEGISFISGMIWQELKLSVIFLLLLLTSFISGCRKCCTKKTCQSFKATHKRECQISAWPSFHWNPLSFNCRSTKNDISKILRCDNCEGELPTNAKCKAEFDNFVKMAREATADLTEIRKTLAENWIKEQSWFKSLNNTIKNQISEQAKKFDRVNKEIKGLSEGQKLLAKNQEKLLNVTRELRRAIVAGLAKQETWYKDLSFNDEKILRGQSGILAQANAVNEEVEKLRDQMSNFELKFDVWKIEEWYKDDIKELVGLNDFYTEHAARDNVTGTLDLKNPSVIDWLNDNFPNKAMGHISNVLKMLIGSTFPVPQESIYATVDNRYCNINNHNRFKYLLQQGYKYLVLATEVNSTDISRFTNSYAEKLIQVDESYAINCECEKGLQLYTSKRISDLIPSLEPTTTSYIENLEKVATSSYDSMVRQKVMYLMRYKNFNPTEQQILAIDMHSMNDIEFAVQLTRQGKTDWIKYKDQHKSCIENLKNFLRKYILILES